MALHRGRKGNVCNLRTGFSRQEGKGSAPGREVKVGSEYAPSPCEEPVLLVPAAVSPLLPRAPGQVASAWHGAPAAAALRTGASPETEPCFGQTLWEVKVRGFCLFVVHPVGKIGRKTTDPGI